MPAEIATALARVRTRMEDAARASGRDFADVTLLLAVKTVPPTRIRAAISAGGALLGQNRAQELLATEPELADLPHATHFIGHLQSNKVNQVTRWVSCVQTLDSASLAHRLARSTERLLEDGTRTDPLDVLIQVNTSGESTKAGTTPVQAPELATLIAELPALRLRGFMTIGANSPDLGLVRASYDTLANVRDIVVGEENTRDAVELSMGMSGDLDIAIAAGATIIRVGSAVFGART